MAYVIGPKKENIPSISMNSVDIHKAAPLVDVIIDIPRDSEKTG